ncbi:hypothetical protein HOV43_gp207 [Escherichia phage vB_EcoM_KWBSE43-6]|uniref:Uncharacterized protein n=1 Tax=Escherichia phage vB_EcoM_KWBSE43-6 TaxID=2508194 RepID=A0A482MZ55_9CAUD|nr:hypothetical protein HOV43_gp207 [Escherichia phage vB_EcoM_KWBSE43-6]QBQ78976.1 hypothetical protein KWBSE43_00156 [Escherichia phage vB_EcoM_KWBSE43-6]
MYTIHKIPCDIVYNSLLEHHKFFISLKKDLAKRIKNSTSGFKYENFKFCYDKDDVNQYYLKLDSKCRDFETQLNEIWFHSVHQQ